MFTAELVENAERWAGLCTLCELGGEFCLQRRKGKGGAIRQNENRKEFIKIVYCVGNRYVYDGVGAVYVGRGNYH